MYVIALFQYFSVNLKSNFTRAVESESGARAYFEESGVGVGRKKFEESESGVGVGKKIFEESGVGVGVGKFFLRSRESESELGKKF